VSRGGVGTRTVHAGSQGPGHFTSASGSNPRCALGPRSSPVAGSQIQRKSRCSAATQSVADQAALEAASASLRSRPLKGVKRPPMVERSVSSLHRIVSMIGGGKRAVPDRMGPVEGRGTIPEPECGPVARSQPGAREAGTSISQAESPCDHGGHVDRASVASNGTTATARAAGWRAVPTGGE